MAAVSRPVTREGRTCFARVDTTCAGACGDMRLGTTGPHPGKEREGGDTAQTPLLICSTIHSVPRRGGGASVGDIRTGVDTVVSWRGQVGRH